jgi:ABC-type bacteriocin/lantibiotic exporter with double-glycine peptidase domain
MEFKKFNSNILNFSKSQFNNYKFGTINYLIPNFVVLIVLSSLVSFGTVVSRLSLEFIGVTLRLVQTLGVINNNLSHLINSHVHLQKFNEIENNKEKNPSFQYKIKPESENAITLSKVSFAYFGSEQKQFELLDLKVPKNKHTIITGSNGSGKSTLLGLLSGVFIPDSGKVTANSSKFSYVGANPLILDSNIKENLLYGNDKKIDEKKLYNLINKFNLFTEKKVSLDYTINNKSLSSGQMQKISFMRALLSDSEILFLDESTSNLDDDSKKLILSVLDDLDITIVNCTHNPEDFNYDTNIKIETIGGKTQANLFNKT